MQKFILFFLLITAFVSTNAQSIVCRDTIKTRTETKTVYEKDTTIIYFQSIHHYDTAWKKSCSIACVLGLKPATNKIKSITAVYIKDSAVKIDSTPYVITNIVSFHDTICNEIPGTTGTIFGVKLQSINIDQYIKLAKDSLHVKAVRPSQIPMYQYTGLSRQIIEFQKSKLISFLTITAVITAGDNIVEYLHGADTIWYKRNIEQFAKDVVNLGYQDSLIAVIENEPINRRYYSGDFKNYIAQLKMSVEILNRYGIKTISGCVHVPLAEAVRTGLTGDSRIDDTRALLTAEKTIPVAYTNTHDQYTNGKFSVTNWVTTVNWIKSFTGHEVVNGEVSSINAQPSVWLQFMNWAKDCKMPYMIFWSGDNFNGQPLPNSNSKGDATDNGVILSNIGKQVQKELKPTSTF
jgi:hypothetical protein